jgi:hypothetical protein
VVLQSPFSTIGSAIVTYHLKFIPESWLNWKWGVSTFPNVERIGEVDVPVFIYHGDQDEIIPWKHSQVLSNHCRWLWRFWLVPGAGHANINSTIMKELDEHFTAFINYLPTFIYPEKGVHNV